MQLEVHFVILMIVVFVHILVFVSVIRLSCVKKLCQLIFCSLSVKY